MLKAAIRTALETSEAIELVPNAYGRRFNVFFRMKTARGEAKVLTAWIILNGTDVPRLTNCFIPRNQQ